MTSGTDHFAISIKSDELATPSDRTAYTRRTASILEQLEILDKAMAEANWAAESLRQQIESGNLVRISDWTRLMEAHAGLREDLGTALDDEVFHLVNSHFVSGREAGRAARMAPATVSRMISKRQADDGAN